MSENAEAPADPTRTSEPGPPAYARALERIVRLHNLMVFIVFVAGLVCLTILRFRGHQDEDPDLLQWLLILRIAIPIAALVITAIYTNLGIARFARDYGDGRLDPNDLLPLFRRCKLVSMFLLTIAGVFACFCLIVGNRVVDLLLAIGTFLLLFATRTSESGFDSFIVLIEEKRGSDSPTEAET